LIARNHIELTDTRRITKKSYGNRKHKSNVATKEKVLKQF